jgi:uncharacterized membrane protein
LVFVFWKKVPRGTSGGITILGSIAALLGAFIIAFSVGFFYWNQEKGLNITLCNLIEVLCIILYITFFGFFGHLIDSTMGATLQGNYICIKCKKTVESSFHKSCGVKTQKQRGFQFINNDIVNLTSGLLSAFLGILICHYIPL